MGVFSTHRTPSDLFPVCSTVACRMVVSRRAELGEAGFKAYLLLQSRLVQARNAQSRRTLARSQKERRENLVAWQVLQPEGLTVASIVNLVLPSGPQRQRKLAQRRIQRYRAHLKRMLREALAGPPVEPLPSAIPAALAPANTSTLPGQLCGHCGGGCCTRGADTAYLSADTLRRVMARQPLLSSKALLQAYLQRLQPVTLAGSCINHTTAGCSLPREMRSDICNSYACEALATLQYRQRAAEPVHAVLVVQRRQDNWRRGDLDADNGITGAALLVE